MQPLEHECLQAHLSCLKPRRRQQLPSRAFKLSSCSHQPISWNQNRTDGIAKSSVPPSFDLTTPPPPFHRDGRTKLFQTSSTSTTLITLKPSRDTHRNRHTFSRRSPPPAHTAAMADAANKKRRSSGSGLKAKKCKKRAPPEKRNVDGGSEFETPPKRKKVRPPTLKSLVVSTQKKDLEQWSREAKES